MGVVVVEEKFHAWYRHSGEPEIDDLPESNLYSYTSLKGITERIAEHHITHMIVKPKDTNILPIVAPRVRKLRVDATG